MVAGITEIQVILVIQAVMAIPAATVDSVVTGGMLSDLEEAIQQTMPMKLVSGVMIRLTRDFRAAINYTSAGSYNEALNILNNINERDARWYFVMSFVQSGLGNNSAALENAAKAKQMDPDNETYNNLYRQLYGGGAGYANTGRQYGRKGGMNQAFFCLPAASMCRY